MGQHSLFIDTMRTLRILGVAPSIGPLLDGRKRRPPQLARAFHSACHGDVEVHRVPMAIPSTSTMCEGERRMREHSIRRMGIFALERHNKVIRLTRRGRVGWLGRCLVYAEQLEFAKSLPPSEYAAIGRTKADVLEEYLRCAVDTSEHYLEGGVCARRSHLLGRWRPWPLAAWRLAV